MDITNTKYIISIKPYDKFNKFLTGTLYSKDKVYYIYQIPKELKKYLLKNYATYLFSANDVIRVINFLWEKDNG